MDGTRRQVMESQDGKAHCAGGWEFLRWHASKKNVDKVLAKRGINTEHAYSDQETGTRVRIRYQEMETWLHFNRAQQLIAITQHKDFNVVEQEESRQFFEQVEAASTQKYGQPDERADDKEKEVATLRWKGEHTRITVTYDYKYKIIDELGCGTYRVDIDFKPAE